ncbi:uncharacterized protein TNCV_629231 [Trichonephila clavipes]|nr:uncharacterized protein TNCV_629231 [Trichonephila clavipes]
MRLASVGIHMPKMVPNYRRCRKCSRKGQEKRNRYMRTISPIIYQETVPLILRPWTERGQNEIGLLNLVASFPLLLTFGQSHFEENDTCAATPLKVKLRNLETNRFIEKQLHISSKNFRRDLILHSAKLEIKRIFRESFRLTASRVARDKPWSILCKKSHGIPSSRAAAVAKFRLLTGHDCLCAHLFRFNLVTSPICVLCDTGQDMTAAHLDECSALNDLNCILLQRVPKTSSSVLAVSTSPTQANLLMPTSSKAASISETRTPIPTSIPVPPSIVSRDQSSSSTPATSRDIKENYSTLTFTPHRSLNSSRGVISEPNLLTTPEAEILDGFSDQGVIQLPNRILQLRHTSYHP